MATATAKNNGAIADDAAIAEFLSDLHLLPVVQGQENGRCRRSCRTADSPDLEEQGPFGDDSTDDGTDDAQAHEDVVLAVRQGQEQVEDEDEAAGCCRCRNGQEQAVRIIGRHDGSPAQGVAPVRQFLRNHLDVRQVGLGQVHAVERLLIERIEIDPGIAFQVADVKAHSRFFRRNLFQFFLGQLAEELVGHGFVFVHFTGFHFSVHQVGDVYDTMHKAELQSRCGQFFGTAFGPEAVRQVVVLHAGVLLDRGISAVVVGQDEAFGRDDFTGTSSAEDADGILQRHAIGVIEVVGFQLQTLFLHHIDGILLLHQLKQPHAFVGLRREGECCGESRNEVLLDFHVCHLI